MFQAFTSRATLLRSARVASFCRRQKHRLLFLRLRRFAARVVALKLATFRIFDVGRVVASNGRRFDRTDETSRMDFLP